VSRDRSSALLRHAVLVVMAVTIFIPVVVTLLTSLKLPRDILTRSFVFAPTLRNYRELFVEGSFGQLTANSLIASIGATAIIIVIASLAAYSLSRFRWPRAVRFGILGILLGIQMLPPIIFTGPFYFISRTLGIYDTPVALIMAYIVLQLPLATLILIEFFAGVPRELEEAAAIDGAGDWTIFLRVALPLVAPGIATAALLTFNFSWNDFLFALTLTITPDGMTIPVGIAAFAQEYQVKYGNMTAAAILATIPALLLVIFAQRYITKGLTLGAVKG
jgi:multiple sugar transport system permease protein